MLIVNTSQSWHDFLEHSAFNLESFERWDASQMEIGVEAIKLIAIQKYIFHCEQRNTYDHYKKFMDRSIPVPYASFSFYVEFTYLAMKTLGKCYTTLNTEAVI